MGKFLIADSGSTKTDWCIVDESGAFSTIRVKGMNPYFQDEEEISSEIEKKLLPAVGDNVIDTVYFYGAGCIFDKVKVVENAIKKHITAKRIFVESDLLGVARAVCGKTEGIACILGTGSNSCLYDGDKIVSNISPLGFILGDEGSGAVLGKLLVGDLLKGILPERLKSLFLEQYGLTPAYIIDKVYRQPFPNRFLAGFAPFLAEHLDEPSIYRLVADSFYAFIYRNVKQYHRDDCEVSFVGSIAYFFRDILSAVASDTGIVLGKIVQNPMDGLLQYHLT